MKLLLDRILRLVVGIGIALSLGFGSAATVLIFFVGSPNGLALDPNGPCWPFGTIALACLASLMSWRLLWIRLPKVEGHSQEGRFAAEISKRVDLSLLGVETFFWRLTAMVSRGRPQQLKE